MAKIHGRWIRFILTGVLLFFFVSNSFVVFAHPNLSNRVNLTAEELAYIKQNPVILVHTEEGWFPYNFIEKNQPKGFSDDYIKLIAEKVGLKVEFIMGFSWDEFLTLLAQKKVDVITNMVITEDRLKFALFSEKPVFNIVNALLYKAGGDEFTNLAQLKGKNLALVRGTFSQELLTKQYPEINLLLTKTPLEAIKQVEAGKADAVLENYANLNYYLDRYFFGNFVNHPLNDASVFAKPSPVHLAIRNDRPILKSILDKAMMAVSEQELNLLYQKWHLSIDHNKTNFSGAELKYLHHKGKINFCVDPNGLPMDGIQENKHIGIGADFMALFQEKIGIPFILIKTKTWSESLQALEQRKCDILSLAVSTPERRAYANFTQPYAQIPLVLVNRNNEPFIMDITKIKHKKIGIVKDYAYNRDSLRVKYPKIKFVDVFSLADGFEKVKRGELFGMVDALPTTTYLIKNNYPSLKIAGGFDETWNLGLAVRNDELLLLSIFEKAIASIDDNTRQNIINKSFFVTYEKGINYFIIKQISIGFLIIGIILFLLYRQYLLTSYNKKLSYISSIDRLTGCFNRLKIEEFLEQQISLNHRYQNNFSLIFYDIDHFKKVNDEYGHLAGDKVLIETTNLFHKNIRKTDLLGRWGGEEFMIICPHTKLQEAQILAESLRKRLEKNYFEGVGYKTASFGVVEYTNSEWSQNDLIKITDEALYQAKEKGRNCVIISVSTSL
jgi:polar amino acid transport system substrate-binding protein